MRLVHWIVIAAVTCTPLLATAQEPPATRPASGERRRGPDGVEGRRAGPPPGQIIEQFRTIARDLNLTDEQKTKVQAALETAAEDFRVLRDKGESMEPRDRRTRAEEIFGTMRKEVSDALTEEQRQTLRKKMSELRPVGGPRPGNEGTGPTTRPGPLLERLQQSLARLGLSDDQQKKVDAVLADAKTQLEEVREGLMSGDEQARLKLGELMMDARRQLGEILTEEQRDKLREMMPAGPPPPPGEGSPPPGQRGRRPGRPGGDEMMGEGMKAPDMREGPPGAGNRPRQRTRDQRRPRGPTTSPAAGSGARVGTPAPDFELTRLDGKPVRPSTLAGRVGVIVFGSYSSPSFRQRAPELEALARQFGSRAAFLIVYTKESHPAGEWDVDRNRDAGIAVQPHKDADARAAQAEKARDALKLTIPIALDTMDDAVASAFGTFPNGAVVLSRDGVILARQQWVDPGGLEKRIEQALKTPASKPAE